MTKLFTSKSLSQMILLTSCIALINKNSDALFLGNIIGCNSFACRLSALENDVMRLKQQVGGKLGGSGSYINGAQLMNGNLQQPYFQQQHQGGFNNPNQFNQGNLNQNLNGLIPANFNQNGGNQQQQQQTTTPANVMRGNYLTSLDDYTNHQQVHRIPTSAYNNNNNNNNQFYRA